MKIIAIITLWLLVFFKRLAVVPKRVGDWLGDHFQWFRKLQGGTWYQWNGFWQKVELDGTIYFKRGISGFDPMIDGGLVWSYRQILRAGDSVISAVEDYTKKEVKSA